MKWLFLPKSKVYFYRHHPDAWADHTSRLDARRRRLIDQGQELFRLTLGLYMLWFCVQIGEHTFAVLQPRFDWHVRANSIGARVPRAVSGTSLPVSRKSIVVYVRDDNTVFFSDGGYLDASAWTNHLIETRTWRKPDTEVLLLINKDVQMQNVHQLLHAIQEAGFQNITFGVYKGR